jgi:hypothetical protein
VSGLRDTQEWFARAVMAGERLDEAPQRLTAGPKLGARERLDVYRRGYGRASSSAWPTTTPC